MHPSDVGFTTTTCHPTRQTVLGSDTKFGPKPNSASKDVSRVEDCPALINWPGPSAPKRCGIYNNYRLVQRYDLVDGCTSDQAD